MCASATRAVRSFAPTRTPVSRDPSHDPDNAGQYAGTSEAERQERITQFALRYSKFSPDEAALLREGFHEILAAYPKQV